MSTTVASQGYRIPFVFMADDGPVLTVELDGSVTLRRPLSADELARLDMPENWNWGPIVKALLRAVAA